MNQVGRYRIVAELGRGATGVVYRALDPAIGRTVAIKSIRLSDFTDPAEKARIRERLLREAQSAGILSHPNIVTVYDVLEQDDCAHIFMEYVDGASFDEMLRRKKLPDRDTLLQLFRQIGDALDYAHRKGIVHRDIKPANIILSERRPDAEQIVKIADFGIAKFVSTEITHQGTLVGTPNYMSPEQIQGLTVSGAADQFSLAVIVYEILCGERPFIADNLSALFYAICKQSPKPVQRLNSALNEAITKIMDRALAKDPARRFPSCSDFIGALTIALADAPEWTPLAYASPNHQPVSTGSTQSPHRAAANGPATAVGTPPQTRVGESVPPGARTAPLTAAANLPSSGFSTRPPAYSRGAYARDFGELPPESSFGRKMALILALCLAVAVAVILIVRLNSGPAIPVQVADTKTAPVSPPPEDLKPPQEPSQTDTATRPDTKEPPKETQPEGPALPLSQSVPSLKPSAADALSRALMPSKTAPANTTPAATVSDVDIVTEPVGARIIVDQNPYLSCRAPCTLMLSSGRHTLSAELNGYAPFRKIFRVPDETHFFLPLQENLGVLVVSSVPPGSNVIVDGQPAGRTPLTLRLRVGEHRLTISDGVRQHQETIEVEPDRFTERELRWP